MEKGEPIVVVKEISKSYGKVEALKEVSFAVEQGEVFGLIGPDGAGKSTLFRILTTLLLADKGTATVNGLDVVTDYKQIRTKVGYMPGRFSLYQDLTVEENLMMGAYIRDDKAQILDELISRCALITLMYQSTSAAEHSSEEHADIIQALVIVFTVAGLAMVKLPGFKAFLGRLTERRKEAA